jgi:hypothetical protein
MTAYSIIGSAGRAAGLDLSAALNSGLATGDTFPAGGDIYLRLKTSGTAFTVAVMNASANAGIVGTFLAPYTLQGGALAATQDKLYGPFPANPFADPSDGLVHLTFTGVTTGGTAGVYRISNG